MNQAAPTKTLHYRVNDDETVHAVDVTGHSMTTRCSMSLVFVRRFARTEDPITCPDCIGHPEPRVA